MLNYKINKKNVKEFLEVILSIVILVLYPCLFMYCKNVSEGSLADILPAFGRLMILALGIIIFSGLLMRGPGKTWLHGEISIIIMLNYHLIYTILDKAVRGMRHIVYLGLVGMIWLLITIAIKKKVNCGRTICRFITLLCTILIVFNFVTALPDLIEVRKTKSNGVDNAISEEAFTKEERPNVYYLILDEYAGVENLGRYYDWDNQEFMDYLSDKQFSISYGSHNTESIWSGTIIPNILNLSYVAKDEMGGYESWKLAENPQLYKLFWNNGYQINMINHQNQLYGTGCNVLCSTYSTETISSSILGNTVYTEIDECMDRILGSNSGTKSYNVLLREMFGRLETCYQDTSAHKPTFTIAYFECPHDYFVFDQNGNFLSDDFITDWKDKEYYLNQLRYVNTVIETTVDNILANDPNALIVIQSDHGARYPVSMVTYYGGPDYDAEEETIYMQNILNCAYYQGHQFDIEGLSGINTWRTILNDVYGTDYEMIEAPQNGYFDIDSGRMRWDE